MRETQQMVVFQQPVKELTRNLCLWCSIVRHTLTAIEERQILSFKIRAEGIGRCMAYGFLCPSPFQSPLVRNIFSAVYGAPAIYSIRVI